MKKLINAPDLVLAESLAGFVAAHADIVALGAENKFVQRRDLKRGKVALISGGGSGHEPLHAGFVGRGMLDAACPGQVFTSPTPDQMVAAVEAVETGSGCLFIVKNYEGDVVDRPPRRCRHVDRGEDRRRCRRARTHVVATQDAWRHRESSDAVDGRR